MVSDQSAMRPALAAVLLSLAIASAGHPASGPETVVIPSGPLTLRAQIWRPSGNGPFPAVIFNHGSYGTADPMSADDPATVGPVFARHGYVFLFLFRQGIGLSAGQGTADGDLMDRAAAQGGPQEKNRVQLDLLEGEEMNEAVAAIANLRAQHDVDPRRIAAVGHSFGGSLSLLLAARDPSLRAVVDFGGAAASWDRAPDLSARLLDAVRRSSGPVLFIHAENDYSVAPGKSLAAEMERAGKPCRLKIYPPVGRTAHEGHNLVYRSVATWERDVFDFLDPLMHRRP
jgi:dienelactone hydrolase